MVAAHSGIWTAAVLSQIALDPVSGILYATLGPRPAFGINAGSFLISSAVRPACDYRPPGLGRAPGLSPTPAPGCGCSSGIGPRRPGFVFGPYVVRGWST
jgi:hypothetical protein